MKQIWFLSLFLNCVLFLSGCAGMNSDFDCNVDSGGKCLPMDDINRMTIAGVI